MIRIAGRRLRDHVHTVILTDDQEVCEEIKGDVAIFQINSYVPFNLFAGQIKHQLQRNRALAESAPSEVQRALREAQRALREVQRALSETQRALSENQRALREAEGALDEDQGALSEAESALDEDRRALK